MCNGSTNINTKVQQNMLGLWRINCADQFECSQRRFILISNDEFVENRAPIQKMKSEPVQNDNLSVRVATQYVQPPSVKQIKAETPNSDLTISIKSAVVPKEPQQPFNPRHGNNLANVRFVANKTLTQYLQNRHSAQHRLADSLQSNSNTKTQSMDTHDRNAEDSSDDSLMCGGSNDNNIIPQKRLFSSLSQPNNPRTMEPKKTQNVNVWSWSTAEVIEWLLSFDVGKIYLCQFARSEMNGVKLTLLNDAGLQTLGVNTEAHRQCLLQQIAHLIKKQNDHNQHIPFRCLYCNVYSPSRVVILQHINQSHKLSLPILLNNKEEKAKAKPKVPDYAQLYNEKTGRWDCSACTSSFAQRSTLRNHLIDKHSIHIKKLKPGRPKESHIVSRKEGNNDKKCLFCKKTYSSVYYLKKHTKKSHNYDMEKKAMTNDNKMQMSEDEEDSQSSYSSSSSIDHSMSQDSIKFKCDRCNEALSSGLDLLAHVAANH
eukprot:1169769_1